MEKLIFATKNKGKIIEIKEIMKDLPFQIVSLDEAGIDIDIEENGATFEENALIKAKTIMELTGSLVLADDSGLEIDYLDGKPGIYSARFGGVNTSYEIKNNKILDLLKGVPKEKRTARFVCAIAAVYPTGDTITTYGTIEGIIAEKPSGNHGFGYDPIFYVPKYQCTTAEMSPEQKNAISHRAKALQKIKEKLKKGIK
ncbi:MAG: XTP/dITP diphosphatase [Epulopiscium sp.]|nr:XTP/dITP diphosphatase [Candidatus Epulonipiscium sp.]